MNTILIAEDDDNDALLLKRAFQKGSSSVSLQRVSDGEEAIAYLRGEKPFHNRQTHPLPGLVVMDMRMPRKTGLEVLKWIRGNPTTHRLRVVMLTSSRQRLDIDHAYEIGANSYLVKPANFDQLTAMVLSLQKYWFELSEKPELSYEQSVARPMITPTLHAPL